MNIPIPPPRANAEPEYSNEFLLKKIQEESMARLKAEAQLAKLKADNQQLRLPGLKPYWVNIDI